MVFTGAGKGEDRPRRSAGLWRCLGHGMKVAIVQFIKGAIDTAEEGALICSVRRSFSSEWERGTPGRRRIGIAIRRLRSTPPIGLRHFLGAPGYAMVILDEFNIVLHHGCMVQ